MSAGKYILIGGLVFLAGRYLSSLIRTGNQVVTQISGKVDKFSIDGVVVALKYNIKNPTRTSIKIAAPLIKLSYKNKVLASSSMKLVDIPQSVKDDKGRIRILPFKETGEITTRILIPFLSLVGVGADLLTKLKDENPTEKVKFTIDTVSTVFTKIGSYPYEEKTIVTI